MGALATHRQTKTKGSNGGGADREVIELGTLSLTATPTEEVKTQMALLFNPLLVRAGIEPSADPVLLARPGCLCG